jgi:LacI family transcriptional regulator
MDTEAPRSSQPATTAGAGDAGGAKPATIYDVARLAGVSHQTVSRFIKGYPGIRPETRDRVVAALEQLDYRPNLAARSLRRGTSHRIAALTHEIGQVGPSKIVQGASDAARDAGYLLDIVTLDMSNPRSIQEAIELVHQLDVAGVLALASTDEMADAFTAADFRVPTFIASERNDLVTGHPTELTALGFPAVITHLVELGHEHFVHIAGPSTWLAARNRARAFDSALATHGLTPGDVITGDWSAKSGYAAIQALPDDFTPTAVVASNDQMALGAMLALNDRGLRVPGDVSVTGVDDIPEAAYFAPPLTTLRVDFTGQGRSAVAELLGTAPSPVKRSELVIRKSTGPAPLV